MTGDIRHFPERRLLVYLPPDYGKQFKRRFPVLYLQDGQNIFDGETAFIHGEEWFVDETAEELIRTGQIQPLIVAAIYNAGDKRVDEYTPTADPGVGLGGSADVYLRWLIDDTKRFVDRRFRTLRDAKNTGIGGSSLGGLLALYAGWKYPAVFGKLAVISPSVWWDREALLDEIEASADGLRQQIWLDIGTEEGVLDSVRRLHDLLVTRSRNLRYVEAPGAGHNEAAWAARVPSMLKFLFPMPD